MTRLTAQQLLDRVTKDYFGNVDAKRLEPALDCFQADATLTIQTDQLTHHGRDKDIKRMFTDFFAGFALIWHGDFNPVIDEANQAVAVQFNALRVRHDGGEERATNCNVFRFKDGKFQAVTIYMSDENPLR
jgi:ketosteroid isomerase-like protein